MAKNKTAPDSLSTPPIDIDRAALARAGEVLRNRNPATSPIRFGPAGKLIPREGFVVHCTDGEVAAAIKVLAENGAGLVDALARAEQANGDAVG